MSATEVRIRKARPEEFREIFQVVDKAFDYYSRNIEQTDHLEETPEDVYNDICQHLVLVLEKEGQLVGSLRLEEEEENIFYLRRFAVLPSLQGQGYGSTLIQRAEKEVKDRGGKLIYLYSSLEQENLVSFYSNLGFAYKEVDRDKGYLRGRWEKEV
ncbi:MAG: GNAT family N-acetyltransferase [Halanaerobiaceae bacterium]